MTVVIIVHQLQIMGMESYGYYLCYIEHNYMIAMKRGKSSITLNIVVPSVNN